MVTFSKNTQMFGLAPIPQNSGISADLWIISKQSLYGQIFLHYLVTGLK